MRRKIFFWLLATILLSTVSVANAQTKKVPRIGVLGGSNPSYAETRIRREAFLKGLRELAYIEGQNIAIDYRWAEGNIERLFSLAAELVQLKVDLIFASGGSQGFAAKKATSTIPIIFVGTIDPVASGLVASLARPGGNVTGFSIGAPGLAGKRLEIIKETIPRLSRVGYLANPTNPAGDVSLTETRAAAKDLGVEVQSLEVQSLDDIERSFQVATKTQIGALVVTQQPPNTNNQKRIVELATKHRLPAIYADTEWIHTGGLMSYGPSIPDLHRRAAIYVDKILKGTKPADLPVEQPVKYELFINLRTAKALGLQIPPVVLMRAERVIK